MMRIDVITIFPDMFAPVLGASILKRAEEQGCVRYVVHNLRDFASDKRRTVDDRPYGGGPGMVMKPEPIFDAVEAIERICHGSAPNRAGCQILLTAPQGERLSQPLAHELSRLEHLIIICGHYEGVDDRIREGLADRSLSIGDYVLTGGELPAMVLVDTVVRLIPGAIGHAEATADESFADGRLEYPQYTRPPSFRGMEVPAVLRSGDHERISLWRKLQSMARTVSQRPDLVASGNGKQGGITS
ncbi:MAG: tRNA (guanosine(37)-N1)-methyltransferase TrmD [Candidatus Omnitrophica bacterium]|nr:tRNA (guanosine(37)-N1)-methyltransferase TrmD [Candidatus Omnitrophota bacterium]